MKSEADIIMKVADLLERKGDLEKEQLEDENPISREHRAYGLWALDDRIFALKWVLDQLEDETEDL